MRTFFIFSLVFIVGCSASVNGYENRGNGGLSSSSVNSWGVLSPAELVKKGEFKDMCRESGFKPVEAPVFESAWLPEMDKLRNEGIQLNGAQFYHLEVTIRGEQARLAFIIDLFNRLEDGQNECKVSFVSKALAYKGMIVAFIEMGSRYRVKSGWKDRYVEFSSDPEDSGYFIHYTGEDFSFGSEKERIDTFGSCVLFVYPESEDRYREVYPWDFTEMPLEVKKVYVIFGAKGHGGQYRVGEFDVNGDTPDDDIVLRTITLQ